MENTTAEVAHVSSECEPQVESGRLDTLFEEVDLFSTALIQGGCTDGVTL